MSFNKAVIECRLHSPAGAKGISQFMPATAKSWGVNPCDPASAIDGQARFMRALLDKFGNNSGLALAGYNAGPGAVEKYKGVPPYKETKNYVRAVHQYEREMDSTDGR